MALIASLLAAQPALASITVGSDLSGTLLGGQPSVCAPIPAPCTSLLGGVHKGNAFPATSPTEGTVTAFRIKTGAGATVTFRLGTVEKSVDAKGSASATGPTVKIPRAGTYTFPTSLPIAVGESPGIDASSFTSFGACFQGGYFFLYNPPLVNGAEPVAAGANSTCELMVNAIVEPSNAFSVASLERIKRRGIVRLELSLPGPGEVTVVGKGIKTATKQTEEFGNLTVPVEPAGRLKRRLADGGSAKVDVTIRFTPDGGAPGTISRTVRLIHK